MAQQPREWFRFVTNKATPKSAEIHIYGDIGETFWGDGVSAQSFVDQLNDLGDVEQLDVRINSPGGSAWDGLTIANALIRHPASVTTHIDGLAASAASIVACAGDEVITSKYGEMMLHNASAVVVGNAEDMREVAAQLEQLNANMATYYADRAGGEVSDWVRAMAKETWYNADEMLSAGLATRIDTSAVRDEVERAAAHAKASTSERFKYPGRPAAPAPTMRASQPSKEGRMADKTTPEPDTAAGNKAPAAGTVTLDQATYEQLMAAARAGAQAHSTLQAQADARVVEAAIDAGKIPLARKDHYLELMKADRADTTDLLTNRLQPGAAVPLTEMGHCADTSANTPSPDADTPWFY
ncbi:Clp protease ClpP [Mycobacterium avium subsp. hominissuis]|uniref:head maturation protease, ClpP-related n=1 Tax=Mycobacterium avium TaxID=1764 RepID=UPI001CC55909|nr:head maturation protease, ClpP-related [Mycobacterium avium]MBZ4509121.1 Clp protease ClpP [Mycobacterium avium subsp. hominissuis]